jgi:hypothetical protein
VSLQWKQSAVTATDVVAHSKADKSGGAAHDAASLGKTTTCIGSHAKQRNAKQKFATNTYTGVPNAEHPQTNLK